jgi:hypothetical protein
VGVKARCKQGRDRVLGRAVEFDSVVSIEQAAALHNVAGNNAPEFDVIITARSNTKPKTAGSKLVVDKIEVLCRQGVSRGQYAVNQGAGLRSGRYLGWSRDSMGGKVATRCVVGNVSRILTSLALVLALRTTPSSSTSSTSRATITTVVVVLVIVTSVVVAQAGA